LQIFIQQPEAAEKLSNRDNLLQQFASQSFFHKLLQRYGYFDSPTKTTWNFFLKNQEIHQAYS